MSLITTVAAVASIAGTAVSVIGGIEQGSAAEEQANQQAIAQERQAEVYRQQAALRRKDGIAVRNQAYVLAEKQRKQGGRDVSEARAAYSGAEVSLRSGSARDAQLELQRRILEDAKATELEGRRRQERLNQEAAQDELRAGDQMLAADNSREAGSDAATAGIFSALGSAATGISSGWVKMKGLSPGLDAALSPAVTDMRGLYEPQVFAR